jgi:hypothetical protein
MLRYVIDLLPNNSVLKKCYTKIRRAKIYTEEQNIFLSI